MRRRAWRPLAFAAVLTLVPLGSVAAQETGDELDACPDGAASAGFEDVSDGNVHAEKIDCAVERELVFGTSTQPPLFSPDGAASRAQVAALHARMLDAAGIDLPDADDLPFEDAQTSVHADDIARLAAAGIVSGTAEDTFAPQQPVTRAQATTIAVQTYEYASGLPHPAEESAGFADVDGVHEASIDAAVALGFAVGRSESTFAPGAAVRRDQLATITTRLLAATEMLPTPDFELTVLHVNDGESMLLPDEESGFPGVARFVDDMLALQEAADTGDDAGALTVSSGDNFLAGPRLNASFDTEGVFYDAIVYNNAGFDAMTIGNHEFDFGPDTLAEFIGAVDEDIPFLSANLDVSGEPVLDDLDRIAPSTVVDVDGRSVGVIGATYEGLESISSPRDVVINEVLPAVQDEIDALQNDGVEHIVLSSHLQDLNEELTLVPELSGIDAVVGGGGGETLRDEFPLFAENADGEQVPVVTTPGNYTDIGRLILGFDEAGDVVRVGQGSQLVPVTLDGDVHQPTVEQVEEPVQAYVEGLEDNVIGTTEVPLDGRREMVRTRETNLGSLLADAMLFEARELADEFNVEEPDVALQNGGGIRNDAVIPAGEVTELDTFNIAAFVNFTSVATIDGDTLADVLEHSVSGLPEPQGFHGQWAGVDFTFELDQPAGDRIVDATVTRADDTTVELIVDGEVVAGEEQFTMASINFLFDGGDDYPFDADIEYQQLPTTYQESLANRIEELGTITAEDYPDLTVEADRYDRFGPVGGDFIE